MRNAFIIFAIVVVVATILAVFFRDAVLFTMMRWNLEPEQPFSTATTPAAPDYGNPDHWAALPDREDNADQTPEGVQDLQSTADVDVFFIHPTTFYDTAHWNQPLDHPAANEFTDEQVLPNQAGVFNTCCRVFAPRYRQAQLYAFFDEGESGPQALELAYQDVLAAFEHFIEHYSNGRPFIIAGHSQGARHADVLLRERIKGSALEQRLVAAYPVGYWLDGKDSVPVCQSPEQLGCQVTWNTMGPEGQTFADTSEMICVNPLTWNTDPARAGFELNLGGVSFTHGGRYEPGVTDAQCADGVLRVSEVRSSNFSALNMGADNYHIYDFSLYHGNIRANAEARVAAYLNRATPDSGR